MTSMVRTHDNDRCLHQVLHCSQGPEKKVEQSILGRKRKTSEALSSADSSTCSAAPQPERIAAESAHNQLTATVDAAFARPLLECLAAQSYLNYGSYYRGTSVPVAGWFQPCRMCRCWTGNTVQLSKIVEIPCCNRCEPEFWRQEYKQRSSQLKISTGASTPSAKSTASFHEDVAQQRSSPAGVFTRPAEYQTPNSKRCPLQQAHQRLTPEKQRVPSSRSVRRKLLPAEEEELQPQLVSSIMSGSRSPSQCSRSTAERLSQGSEGALVLPLWQVPLFALHL